MIFAQAQTASGADLIKLQATLHDAEMNRKKEKSRGMKNKPISRVRRSDLPRVRWKTKNEKRSLILMVPRTSWSYNNVNPEQVRGEEVLMDVS